MKQKNCSAFSGAYLAFVRDCLLEEGVFAWLGYGFGFGWQKRKRGLVGTREVKVRTMAFCQLLVRAKEA